MKRFRVKKVGGRISFVHRSARRNHYLSGRSSTQKSRLRSPCFVHASDLGRIRALMNQ